MKNIYHYLLTNISFYLLICSCKSFLLPESKKYFLWFIPTGVILLPLWLTLNDFHTFMTFSLLHEHLLHWMLLDFKLIAPSCTCNYQIFLPNITNFDVYCKGFHWIKVFIYMKVVFWDLQINTGFLQNFNQIRWVWVNPLICKSFYWFIFLTSDFSLSLQE